MKKEIIKLNKVINKKAWPVIIMAVPILLIFHNTKIEINEYAGNKIIQEYSNIKYLYLMVFIYIIYSLISITSFILEYNNKEKDITFIFFVLGMILLLYVIINNTKFI